MRLPGLIRVCVLLLLSIYVQAQWTLESESGPPARSSHVSVAYVDAETGHPMVLIHGGYGDRSFNKLSDVWTYDTVTRHWVQMPTTGSGPGSVAAHCGMLRPSGPYLYTFGGAITDAGGFDTSSAVHKLHIPTGEWSLVTPPSGSPPARQEAACATTPVGFKVFAGVRADETSVETFQDTWVFSWATEDWTPLVMAAPLPAARFSAAAVALSQPGSTTNDTTLWVIGGRRFSRSAYTTLRDGWSLPSVVDGWQRRDASGPSVGRIYHTMSPSNDGTSFLLFGGYTRVGPTSAGRYLNCFYNSLLRPQPGVEPGLVWEQATVTGDVPRARLRHSSAQVNDTLYVFGGSGSDDTVFDDLWSIKPSELTFGPKQDTDCGVDITLNSFATSHVIIALLSFVALCFCIYAMSLRRNAFRRRHRRRHRGPVTVADVELEMVVMPLGGTPAMLDALPTIMYHRPRKQNGGDDADADYESVFGSGSGSGSGGGGGGPNVEPGSPTSNSSWQSCGICLTDYEEGNLLTVLPCGHRWHQMCVRQWLQTNSLCPMCKADVFSGV